MSIGEVRTINTKTWTFVSLLCATAVAACSSEGEPASSDHGVALNAVTLDGELDSESSKVIAVLAAHGMVLTSAGEWVEGTWDLVRPSQERYLAYLLEVAPADVRAVYEAEIAGRYEGAIQAADGEGVEAATARTDMVEWLLDSVAPPDAELIRQLNTYLYNVVREQRAKEEDLSSAVSDFDVMAQDLTTTLSGQQYIDQCIAAGVPVPTQWSRATWTYRGTQTTKFVAAAWNAEVYSWTSSSPQGVCVALPRWESGASVDKVIGIVCQGTKSNKACFFDTPAGVDPQKNQAYPLNGSAFVSGAALRYNDGGVCSACHAGENAYYVHPGTAVDLGKASVDTTTRNAWFAKGWVRPMVHSSWAQNPGPGKELDRVPLAAGEQSCLSCHNKASGTRLPRLEFLLGMSGEDGRFCSTAMNGLSPIGRTMPWPTPSNQTQYPSHVNAFHNGCVAGAAVTTFGGTNNWRSAFWVTSEVPMVGDFTGDGRLDLVKFTMGSTNDARVSVSTGSSFNASGLWHTFFGLPGEMLRVGDFNGDGKDDIIVATLNSSGTVYVAKSTGTAFGSSSSWNGHVLAGEVMEVGDFNGDREDDIAIFTKGATNDVLVQLSSGSSFGSATTWSTYFSPGAEVPLTGDFNGDSFDDIVTFTRGPNTTGANGDVYVALSSGTAFNGAGSGKWHQSFGLNGEIQRVADVNGDGFDDIITFVMSSQTSSNQGDVWVATSNGTTGFNASVRWHQNFGLGSEIPFVADVDADHRADAVVFSTNGNVLVAKATP